MSDSQIAVFNKKDLEKVVESSVQHALKRMLPTILRRADLPKYLTTSELSRLAGWSKGKISYMRKEKRIKYIQEGRSIIYPTEWILEYLDKHKITPREEVLDELSSDKKF